jgi:hypothetical protein
MAEDTHRAAGHPRPGVAERLQRLRALCVAESDSQARRRLAAQPPAAAEPFAAAVARRLDELRALCDLAKHLSGARGGRLQDGTGGDRLIEMQRRCV